MDFLAADKLPFVYRRLDFIAFGLVASMMMVLQWFDSIHWDPRSIHVLVVLIDRTCENDGIWLCFVQENPPFIFATIKVQDELHRKTAHAALCCFEE